MKLAELAGQGVTVQEAGNGAEGSIESTVKAGTNRGRGPGGRGSSARMLP